MEEYNKFQISFRTCNSCVIKVPKHFKDQEEIKDFILDKIAGDELYCWIEKWFNFEIEDFEIVE